jgi:hypothetical protein
MTAAGHHAMRLLLAGILLLTASGPPASAQLPAFLTPGEPAAEVRTAHLVAVAEPVVPVVAPAAATAPVVTLRLRIEPRPGMRIYAHDVDGYVPFTLVVEGDADVTPGRQRPPPSDTYVFPPTGEVSRVYETRVVMRQDVTLGPAAVEALGRGEAVPVTATLRYQACDDRLCYRPETARVQWMVEAAR